MSNKFKPYDDKSLMDVFRNIPSTGNTQRNKSSYGQNHTSADSKIRSLYHDRSSGIFSTQSQRTLQQFGAYTNDKMSHNTSSKVKTNV